MAVAPQTPPSECLRAPTTTLRPRSVRSKCATCIPNRKIHPTKAAFADIKVPLKFTLSGLRVKALLVLVGAMATVCVGWTSWLILLIVKPNETVNWVMKTQDFGNGSFWLMVDAPAEMNRLAVGGYSLVWLLYCAVLVRAIRRQSRVSLGPSRTMFESGLSKSRAASGRVKNWFSHHVARVSLFLKLNHQHVVRDSFGREIQGSIVD